MVPQIKVRRVPRRLELAFIILIINQYSTRFLGHSNTNRRVLHMAKCLNVSLRFLSYATIHIRSYRCSLFLFLASLVLPVNPHH